MISTSVFDFRKNLAVFLNEVEKNGTRVVIKKFGKPVAVMYKYEEKKNDFEKFYGMFPRKESGVEFENKVRRSKREKIWMNRYDR